MIGDSGLRADPQQGGVGDRNGAGKRIGVCALQSSQFFAVFKFFLIIDRFHDPVAARPELRCSNLRFQLRDLLLQLFDLTLHLGQAGCFQLVLDLCVLLALIIGGQRPFCGKHRVLTGLLVGAASVRKLQGSDLAGQLVYLLLGRVHTGLVLRLKGFQRRIRRIAAVLAVQNGSVRLVQRGLCRQVFLRLRSLLIIACVGLGILLLSAGSIQRLMGRLRFLGCGVHACVIGALRGGQLLLRGGEPAVQGFALPKVFLAPGLPLLCVLQIVLQHLILGPGGGICGHRCREAGLRQRFLLLGQLRLLGRQASVIRIVHPHQNVSRFDPIARLYQQFCDGACAAGKNLRAFSGLRHSAARHHRGNGSRGDRLGCDLGQGHVSDRAGKEGQNAHNGEKRDQRPFRPSALFVHLMPPVTIPSSRCFSPLAKSSRHGIM